MNNSRMRRQVILNKRNDVMVKMVKSIGIRFEDPWSSNIQDDQHSFQISHF